jgi:transposase
VLALVTVLRAVTAATKDLDRSVAAHLGEHPDGEIFSSLPRSGKINAAQMLAEWGDCREAYDGPDAVAALAGLTPVTKESGKHRAVHFRWACNKRFRRAVTIFADNSRHASPWAAKIYTDARVAGKDHPHAIRILARAWTRVIYRCWLDGVRYDPARHGNAAALTKPPAAA